MWRSYSILILCHIIYLCFCCSGACLCRDWPDTTDGVYVFNDQLPGGMGEALNQFAAQHYSGSQKILRTDADRIRAYNPNFIILHYRLGLGLGYRIPDDMGDLGGPWVEIIEGDNWIREWPENPIDEWFYPYSGSARVFQNQLGWYLIDPDNTSYREFLIGEINRQLTANDNDGLFADSFSVPNYMGGFTFTPPLPEHNPDFEELWKEKIERFLPYIKMNIAPNAKLIPNVGAWITTRDQTDYMSADGVMVENFSAWGYEDYYDTDDWKLQMNRILDMVNADKIVICQGYLNSADEIRFRLYLLSNYLLIKGSKTFVNMELSVAPEWFPEYSVDLGAPQDAPTNNIDDLYSQDLGVYVRVYEKGVALVNPSNENKTIILEKTYRRLAPQGGGEVPVDADISDWKLNEIPCDMITLHAHSGAVLLDGYIPHAALDRVEVRPDNLMLYRQNPTQITALAYFSNGEIVDISATGTWTTTLPCVASISPYGLLTPTGEGSAQVTCTYTYGDMAKSDSVDVSVRFEKLLRLSLSPPFPVIRINTTRKLSCIAVFLNSVKNVGSDCFWYSSNPATASVDQQGNVTALRKGTARIYASYMHNFCLKTAKATVNIR